LEKSDNSLRAKAQNPVFHSIRWLKPTAKDKTLINQYSIRSTILCRLLQLTDIEEKRIPGFSPNQKQE